MRDEVLEAVAVARFQVSSNGDFVVSLTKPTDYSRLNDSTETLRTWRFHPASRNGVAIDLGRPNPPADHGAMKD